MSSLPFDESSTFTPPSAFGPYRVLHQIGSGVLGPVFRTYDPQSDRLVAVKAFRLDLLPEDVARLADGLRRLVGTSGHVAAGLEGTTAYLAMDYYAAETLDVALRHLAPAPLETALPILRGIGECIDRAWSAGQAFGHGALHPRDVFVTPGTGESSVTGFGVARALEAIGARPPVRRPYTAPERAAGGAWDVRADVYSLGAVAHELLTGRRPAGPGEQDGSLPASMAPELRVQIRRVLARALAEVPAQRFGSASEFLAALTDPASVTESDASPIAADPGTAAVAIPATLPRADAAAATEGSPSPLPPRRPRPRVPPPSPRPPVRVAARETLTATDTAPSMIDPVLTLVDPPLLRRDDGPARVALPPLPLPSPFPWAAFVAGCVACLVLGAAGGYQLAMPRRAKTVAPATSAPALADAPKAAQPVSPAAVTQVPTDTEVAVAETSAAERPEPAAKPVVPPKRPAAAAGRLLVRSTPAGALVTVDGKGFGRTPLTLRELALASHTVVVSKPGFTSETRRITLTGRAPSSTLSVTLTTDRAGRSGAAAKPAATGSVTVDSRPRGAQVTIDGRAVGATPLSAPGLSPGVHTVRVELAGYKPVTTSVTVKAGETAKIAVTLEQR